MSLQWHDKASIKTRQGARDGSPIRFGIGILFSLAMLTHLYYALKTFDAADAGSASFGSVPAGGPNKANVTVEVVPDPVKIFCRSLPKLQGEERPSRPLSPIPT